MGRGMAVLAQVGKVIAGIAALIAAIIALGILFRVLEANPGNTIVAFVSDLAGFFVAPFDEMFRPKDPKIRVGVNWGIALVVYLIVGQLISSLLSRAGTGEP